MLFIKNSMLQIVIYKKLNFWEEYTPLIGTVGHPQQMMMQQKWDQLRTYAPVKHLFDNMDVLISVTNDRAR